MSGLFRPPAQEPVFTLGNEENENIDQADALPVERGLEKPDDVAPLAPVAGRKDDASTSSAATAHPAASRVANGTSGAQKVDVAAYKGNAADEAVDRHLASMESSTGQRDPALPVPISADKPSSNVQPQSNLHAVEPANDEQPPDTGQLSDSSNQIGTAQAEMYEDIDIPGGGRHLDEDEEQRVVDELAALEAEAEAQALQEQQRRSAPAPSRDGAHSYGSDSVSLHDNVSQAEHAMPELQAEAQRSAQQASAGATAAQTALDSFEPRKRPFSPPPGSAPLQRFSPTAEYVEPPEYRGLLFFDGLDSLGRPVIIVNADAMGEQKGSRKSAFQYIVRTLEPVVIQGPYVLLLVSLAGGSKSSKVQTGLLISAYRGLSRPFRKNVKYIILVRPSKPVKGLLSFLRPFVSRKAHRKILKIEDLSAIAEATNNEVTLANLGPRFTDAAAELLEQLPQSHGTGT